MKHLLLATVVGGMSLASVNQASAAVITQYFDSATNTSFTAAGVATSTSTPASVGQFQASFIEPTFDPSFGTLNSITVSISVSGFISALVNGAAGDAYSAVVVGIPFSLKSSVTGAGAINDTGEGYADNPSGAGASQGGAGPGFTGMLATTGTNIVGTNSFTLAGSNLTTTLTGAALASYMGSGGTVSFNFRTGSADIVNGNIPQNDLEGANSLERVKATVSADYTPAVTTVPEPASMVLLGMGLVGAGLVRRRNR